MGLYEYYKEEYFHNPNIDSEIYQRYMKVLAELSEKMNNLFVTGKGHIYFVIGGSLGLSDNVLKRADMKLSFSRMTFPHQLMRVILLEQIYRGFRIMNNEPYHK